MAATPATAVELGFVETRDPDSAPLCDVPFDDWDGGKVGGKPVWLVPSSIPPAPTCGRCQRVMPLLLQLFAPIDDAGANPDAYYRMLYVFVCTSGACVNRAAGSDEPSRSVLVLRCQVAAPDPTTAPAAATCEVCGHSASSRCSKCRRVSYCSREHQAAHWRVGHKLQCGGQGLPPAASPASTAALAAAACILPELELYTEPEPPLAERRRLEIEALPAAARLALNEHNTSAAATSALSGDACAAPPSVSIPAVARGGSGGAGSEAGGCGGEEGDEAAEESLSLAGVTQRKLAQLTGAQLFADLAMRAFQQRTACRPAQCVRYLRWSPLPLWRPAGGSGAGASNGGSNGVSASGPERPLAGGSVLAVGGDGESQGGSDKTQQGAAAGEDEGDGEEDDDEEEEEDAYAGAPLWLSQRARATHDDEEAAAGGEGAAAAAGGGRGGALRRAPGCGRCGAPRRFEFQVLPQLIAALGVDSSGGGGSSALTLDFGTIAVFTCTASCSGAPAVDAAAAAAGTAYVEEWAWVQPTLDDKAVPAADLPARTEHATSSPTATGTGVAEKGKGVVEGEPAAPPPAPEASSSSGAAV